MLAAGSILSYDFKYKGRNKLRPLAKIEYTHIFDGHTNQHLFYADTLEDNFGDSLNLGQVLKIMEYIEHFSEQSEDYLSYRPQYPKELFLYFQTQVSEHQVVWDCGTGNGQAAVELAKIFQKVIATDISQAQLQQAVKKENIVYQCSPAEKTNIASQSVDLVTVAQALHWFSFEPFYQEVRRVLKPNGWIAAWCYSLGQVTPEIDELTQKLYRQLPWPSERHYIEEKYETIPFPFYKIKTPSFQIEKNINFEQFIGYLNTWSAVKEYMKHEENNPIDALVLELEKAWGGTQVRRYMRWHLYLLMGTQQN